MRTTRILTATAVLFIAIIARAQEFREPGWFRPAEREVQVQLKDWNDENLIDPESEPSGGFGIMSLVSYPEIAEAITPEIQALARGLENDPQEIFQYVRDHIRYVHYFGSKKGAQLTLLERSGNDFDQCALLVALLRAAGHTASYRFGTVFMSYEITSGPNYHRDFKHWLGLSEPNSNWTNSLVYAVSLNDYRGFPFTGGFFDVPNALVFHHVWVRLTWNNTVYSLDPAFKRYEPISGINLSIAMGLDTNQLITAAGGTVTANYVQNMSEANLRNKLRDYTTNFLNYVQSNYPNASAEEVLGGQSLEEGQFFGGSLPFSPFLWEDTAPAVDWDYIPTNLMATLKITVDATTNRFLYTPQLQGQRLSLTFSNNGLAQLWLDDDLLLQKQTSGGSSVNVALAVDHPHGTWDWTSNRLINTNWNDHTVTNTYQRTNASYAISYAFEPDREWLLQRQRKLDQYRQQGLSDTSREVVTETLNVMGLNWMLQTERLSRVLTAQQDMLLQHHHRIGRMAQEFGKGYYVDVYLQLSGTYAASGISSNDLARSDKAFDLESYLASAAEHGLIEQLQASNLVAASTIKMLQIGNTNGQRTYIANSANWSTINGNLSNYDKPWLKANYIDKGYTLLLPANGANTVGGAGTWSGYGIVARGTITNASSVYKDMVMLISGGYNGGYVSDPYVVVNPPYVYEWSYSQPTYFDPAPVYVPPVYGADPVSMVDGSFHLSTTDLSLGQAEPRGITLSRHYSSSRRHHNLAGMANGWVHSYYARAADVSAPLAGLGDTTPAQMAPLIVATKAAFELYSTTATPKNWAVSSLIAKWGIDQIINNAVSVSLGKDTLQFTKQPNGTFTPPAGSTHALLKTNGAYWLRERNGNTFKFNGAGFLTNIVDQYSQGLTITYNASNWVSTVKDWKNRQFTFNYTGTPLRLTSITDSTTPSRSVSFGYSGNNLTGVTDPENKTSTFVYDSNHQIIATKDALNRVVVSNAYDGFGRVIEQYSHGDTNKTWRLYWSGFRNVEQDPAGGRKQYFYDEKHRLVRTIDAMGHYTDNEYDGQDHLVRVWTHLFNRTDYHYDGRHNLVAIQDPLYQWKDFFYDSSDNLWRVWDERGNNSYFGYNSKFQMTGSTNNAGDWTTFAYNATDGTLTSRTDPGGTTTYGYDSYGQLGSITHPGGLGAEGFLNNARGDISSRTNGRSFVTSFQYNQRRELTNSIAPTNLTAKVAFDAVGNVFSTTDARGFITSNTWSATGKLLARALPATPQGVPVITNSYDSRDWLTRTANPLQQATHYTNDAAQRLIAATDSLVRTTRFTYDGDNRRIGTTNAASEVTRQYWSKRDELETAVDGANRQVDYWYDEAGNRTWLLNRRAKWWQFQYDAANRLTNTITPLNRQTKQIYNNRGLLQTVIEPSGDTATLTYDAKARLTNRTDNVGAITYRYDASDNRTNIVEAGKTNSWTFDAYDRVSSYRDTDGNVIQYRTDANGNLTNLVYPGGKIVSYFYDSLNRLTNVTDWANRKTTIEYDLASRVQKIIRPNGTVREMNYDAAGQMTNIVERLTNNAPIAFFKLNWNNAGRIESEFAAPLPQLHTPPTRVMTFDNDNRIATFNGNSVTHDLDGNMTSGPGTNNTFINYTYDARNRLLSAGGLNYAYDPLANRTSITNGANVTRFVINPNAALSQVLICTKPDGSKTFYVYGIGLLYEVNETSGGAEINTRTYHYDYRGSTVAITDGSGIPTDRIEYSAYATITYRAGSTDTPFLFNGRYGVQTDPNGLLYMRARFYNPLLCRFINADPSGFLGGLNFYAYADGNPISLIDPFGLWTFGVGVQGQGAFIVAVGLDVGFYVGRDPVTRKWSYGGLFSGFLGAGGPVAAYGGGFVQVTSAPSVASLKGLGVQSGGSIDVGYSLGADYVGGLAPDGISYHGGQVNFGLGVALFGAELHHGLTATAGWDNETGWTDAPFPWSAGSAPANSVTFAPGKGIK
jgi:RHS repeat-associated protein